MHSLQLHGRGAIMAEFHAKFAFPLSRCPQLCTEAEHGIQTTIGIQREILRSDFRVANHCIALV